MTEDCVFCKIKNKKNSSSILFEDDFCFVINDINPVAPVHSVNYSE
ncbi:MAG: HIT family protein [Dehalococcoidia bacterium]